MGDFLSDVLVIAGKDLRIEMRSRDRIVAMAIFAALVAVVFAFALDPTVRASTVAGAMLWVTVLFAGMLGLSRSFSMESEEDALTGLLLAPIDRRALFLGKMLANLALLLGVALVIFPVFALFFGLPLGRSVVGLSAVVVLASIGFMALGTLFSAIAVHTRLGETMLPILLLPLLIPVVIFAASATQRLIAGRPLAEVEGSLRMLLAFDLIFLVGCTLVFPAALEE